MTGFWAVYRREMLSLWVTPLAWLLCFAFLLLQGISFYVVIDHYAHFTSLSIDQGPAQTYFSAFFIPISLLLVCPALTMGIFAEERRSGTIEALLTAPVSGGAVVHAKYAAALSTYLLLWLPTVLYVVIVRKVVAVDWGVVAASYLVSALVMLPARSSGRPSEAAESSVRDDVFGFLGTIRHDRVLLHLMSLTAIAEVLGFSHQALLPSLARDVLQVGPEGLGVMTAARQVGGLAGIAFTSGLGGARYGPLFLSVIIGFGASLVALGFAPSFTVVLLILVGANALGAVTDVLAQTLIQLAVPSGLRGRAGGAWVVSIGMAPLGQFQVGALASLFGVSAALGVNGVALMAVGAAAALLVPKLRRL